MKNKAQLIEDEKILLRKEQNWKVEKNQIERRQKIHEEKFSLFTKYVNIHISTTKLLILFLFLSCTAIEIFTGYVTVRTLKICEENLTMFDFTPLVTLIGAVVGEVFGFAIYSLKATKENTIGGIVYETAMKNNDNNAVG